MNASQAAEVLQCLRADEQEVLIRLCAVGFSLATLGEAAKAMQKEISAKGLLVELTGPDWEPTEATRYYAMFNDASDLSTYQKFEFGPTPAAAIAALLK